jgi:uncharacterized protein (DUF1330 family)
MTALWIAHVRVTDPDRYGQYAARATTIIPAHGGCWLVRAGRYETLEGPDFPRQVVARFPSLATALACYNSPEYQEALAFARGAAERQLVIVEENAAAPAG